MFPLITLTFITVLIFYFQKKIWEKAPVIIFPLCTLIFYYWSLSGAWVFIFDQSFNEIGRGFNMTYYNYLEKVYPVKLDGTYSKMILYYGFFILSFQLSVFGCLRLFFNKSKTQLNLVVIKLHPVIISLISLIFIFASYKIVEIPILKSIQLEESIYINVRKGIVPNYVFHQLLNLGASFLMYFYFAIYLMKGDSKFDVVPSKFGNYLFILIFILLNVWLVFLGNRHEILISGIMAFLYLTFPSFHKNQIKSVVILFLVLTFSFLITDPLRSLSPKILSSYQKSDFINSKSKEINKYIIDEIQFNNNLNTIENDEKESEKKIVQDSDLHNNLNSIENDEKESEKNIVQASNLHNNNVSHVYYNISLIDKLKNAFGAVVFSNEMFSGQFSMYAVLKEDIEISYGHSVKSMFYTFIPKSIIKRSESSYEYYASKLDLNKNQGFTINHATDWFLNFGVIGVFMGGIFWGIIMFLLFIGASFSNNNILRSFLFFSLINVAAYFAIIIRGGIDVMKIIVFESILIPFFLVFSSHLIYVWFIQIKNNLLTKKNI